MTPYSDTIQDHAKHPRNYGSLDAPDIRAEDVNPFCGDRVRIDVALSPQQTVSAARFQGDLCAIARAASSLLTEMIAGAPLARVRAMTDAEQLEALGSEIQPARRSCALLPLVVLRSGVARWNG